MRRHLLVIVLAAAAAGCTGANTNPLAPASAGAAFHGAAGGGPSSYDASGRWFGLVFLGDQRIGEGVHIFTQEPSGSLTAVGSEAPDDPERDHGVYTFKRIGSPNGTIRTYRFSLHMDPQEEGVCGRELSGTAELDTSTNTLVATGSGIIDNCAEVTITFKWVKQ